MKNEHRWKFRVGSGAVDQYRVVTDHEAPRIEVLDHGEWRYFAAGLVVAEEMLRLAGELHQAQVVLADFALKEQELFALAAEIDPESYAGCECAACHANRRRAEQIRSILRLPE